MSADGGGAGGGGGAGRRCLLMEEEQEEEQEEEGQVGVRPTLSPGVSVLHRPLFSGVEEFE